MSLELIEVWRLVHECRMCYYLISPPANDFEESMIGRV